MASCDAVIQVDARRWGIHLDRSGWAKAGQARVGLSPSALFRSRLASRRGAEGLPVGASISMSEPQFVSINARCVRSRGGGPPFDGRLSCAQIALS